MSSRSVGPLRSLCHLHCNPGRSRRSYSNRNIITRHECINYNSKILSVDTVVCGKSNLVISLVPRTAQCSLRHVDGSNQGTDFNCTTMITVHDPYMRCHTYSACSVSHLTHLLITNLATAYLELRYAIREVSTILCCRITCGCNTVYTHLLITNSATA